MNFALLIASPTSVNFAGLGLSRDSINLRAHSSVAAIRGRLASEVGCSGAASEMFLGNDILRLDN